MGHLKKMILIDIYKYTDFSDLRTNRIPDFYKPKTLFRPIGSLPQNFSLIGYAVFDLLRNKQTDRHTNKDTITLE